MSSIFPEAIDGYATLPFAIDKVTPVNADSVNRLRSAIINIENTIGTKAAGESGDISERLETIESSFEDLEISLAAELASLGITNVTYNEDGSITILWNDGDSSHTTGDLTGATGLPGPGITSITDGGDGTLTIEYGDGSAVVTGDLTGPEGPAGHIGVDGAAGASAYEIAVEEGFHGSTSDWLSSLEGGDGEDGASAYEIAVTGGFVGTEAEWLLSLEGSDAEADNLGNHIATENLQMSGNWISNDGGDEGIFINAAGDVRINGDSSTGISDHNVIIDDSSSTDGNVFLQSHRKITLGHAAGETIDDSPQIRSHWSADNVLELRSKRSEINLASSGKIGVGHGTHVTAGSIEGEGIVNINASALTTGATVSSGLEIFNTDVGDDFIKCKNASTGNYVFNLNGDGKLRLGIEGTAKNDIDINGHAGIDTREFSVDGVSGGSVEICRYHTRFFRAVEVFLTVTDGDGNGISDEHMCVTVNMINTGNSASSGAVHHSEYGVITAKGAHSPWSLTNGFVITSSTDGDYMVLSIAINAPGDTFVGRAVIKAARRGSL